VPPPRPQIQNRGRLTDGGSVDGVVRDPTTRVRRTDLPEATVALARFLLGCLLVHETPEGRAAGRIVEVEAYLPHDRACHAYRGRTRCNASLFLERGHAYVHLSYGVHFLLNVTAGREGVGTGVLLRALEPVLGLEVMRRRRPGVRDPHLARGPGCLTRALAIGAEWDGRDLCAEDSALWLARAAPYPPERIARSPRVGIRQDAHRLLRFFVRNHPCVSGPRPRTPPAARSAPRL
jgi:DNA-3-methyladenine glycosylase